MKDILERIANSADEISRLRVQRDELLAALVDALTMVEDWSSYASDYFTEKYDLAGDIAKLNASITSATQSTTKE